MAPGSEPRGAIERSTFTYLDADGIEITVYRWDAALAGDADEPVSDEHRRPDGADGPDEQRGIVQILHGIGDHALRYDDFARLLAARGFTVYADDHRGHGATGERQYGGDLTQLGRLGPGGLRAAEAAIQQLTGLIRDRHPGLPVTVFGHSMGSLMVQRIINRHPRTWDAVVLSGAAYRTLRHMESGDLNRRWRGRGANGNEWLSRDPAVQQDFADDPYCFDADVFKLFGVADALRLAGTPAAGLSADVPILIIGGTDDTISRGDGRQRLAAAYRRRGVRDVTLKLYPGARHEILNELNGAQVTADLIRWITAHDRR